MNLTYIENLYNSIIDFTDVDVPLPINIKINELLSKQYHSSIPNDPAIVYRNILDFDNRTEVNEWATNFVFDNVIPKFYEHWIFENSYPHSPTGLKNNITVGVTLMKDSVGFKQAIHIDPQWNVLAGVIHLQDAINNGTVFYWHDFRTGECFEKHKSPSKKFSGSIWANMPNSLHGVESVTQERLFYLISVKWNLKF